MKISKKKKDSVQETPKEKARKIYESSTNESTDTQKKSAEKLEKLYNEFSTDDVADYYAMILFDLSMRVSGEKLVQISEKLKNLYEKNKTEGIAERIGRIEYNLSLNNHDLMQSAEIIEKLYREYQTDPLAEPLVKIWHSIYTADSDIHEDYAQRIIEFCSKKSHPGTNEAYAKILFDEKVKVKNREELMADFLSKTQTLDSFGSYLKSPYYPMKNELLREFRLSEAYPVETIGVRMNEYFFKIRKCKDFVELKIELLAALYYTFAIKRLLMVTEIYDPVGHYTKVENLKYLVAPKRNKGKLRMSNACYMNDPLEGKILMDILLNDTQNFSELYEEQSNNIYLSCFTAAIAELPMWSMYGDDGKGCCLIIKNNFFDFTTESLSDEFIMKSGAARKNNYLFQVVYLSKEEDDSGLMEEDDSDLDNENIKLVEMLNELKKHIKRIDAIIDDKDKNIVVDALGFILGQIRYLFKDASYAHEQEYRLINYSENPLLDNDKWIVPQLYVEVKKPLEYEKIILGPKVEQANRIIPYLLYTGKVEEVKKSKIRYR